MHSPALERLIRLGCCALSLACQEDKKPGAPPELPIALIDADLSLGSGPKSDAAMVTELPAKANRIAELEGTWRGQADTKEFGLVRAEVNVDPQGQIHSQADGPGLHRRDLFFLTQWDGATLGVAMEDGTKLVIKAELHADEISVTLPQVGAVTLHRGGRRAGL